MVILSRGPNESTTMVTSYGQNPWQTLTNTVTCNASIPADRDFVYTQGQRLDDQRISLDIAPGIVTVSRTLSCQSAHRGRAELVCSNP